MSSPYFSPQDEAIIDLFFDICKQLNILKPANEAKYQNGPPPVNDLIGLSHSHWGPDAVSEYNE